MRRSLLASALVASAAVSLGCNAVLGIEDIKVEDTAGATGTGGATSSSSSGSGGAGGSACGAPRTVAGTDQPVHVVNPVMEATESIDLSQGHVIQALSPNGDGTFQILNGVGTQSGAFTIAKVPDCPYYLDVDDEYFWITDTSSQPEIAPYVAGRIGVTKATQDTLVSFTVTGMQAWADIDQIQAVSLNAGGVFHIFLGPSFNAMAGMTTFTDAFNWTAVMTPPNLLVNTDVLWLTQNVAETSSDGTPYWATMKFVTFQGATLSDGQSPALAFDSSFTQLDSAAWTTATVSWKVTDYENAAKGVSPKSKPEGGGLLIDALPGALSHGQYMQTPDVLIVPRVPGAADLVNVPVQYTDPFNHVASGPLAWTEYGIANYRYHVDYSADGGMTSVRLQLDLGYAADVSVFEKGTPVPLQLSAPQNLTIDNKPFTSDVALSTTTPKLAWGVPATTMPGVPLLYTVNISRIYTSGSLTRAEKVATFHTDQTTLAIPDLLLKSGESYAFVLVATQATGFDYKATPNRRGLPLAHIAVPSGLVKVP